MHFTAETSSNGVIERNFTLGEVTGILWSPESGSDHAPVVLMGHSGGLHKKAPGILARARHYVGSYGFRVAAIDAPGHGHRPRNAEDERWVADLWQARAGGEPIGPIIAEFNGSLADRAVPEWQATLDALQALPEIGTEAPVGYGGMTLGTATGLLLTAIEPRITAASFGGVFVYEALTEAARRITVPIEFVVPWDDEEIDRQSGLALFDACASTDKALRAYPGRHNQMPRFEVDNSARFFARHLSRGTMPPVCVGRGVGVRSTNRTPTCRRPSAAAASPSYTDPGRSWARSSAPGSPHMPAGFPPSLTIRGSPMPARLCRAIFGR